MSGVYFNGFECRYCKSINTISEKNEKNNQIGTRCQDCGRYTFQPKEKSKNREASSKNLVEKKGINYCQWCLRKKDDIPAPGTLEAHHIIEYKDEGENDLQNILILCTACHKQCHHDRTYFGHYNKS